MNWAAYCLLFEQMFKLEFVFWLNCFHFKNQTFLGQAYDEEDEKESSDVIGLLLTLKLFEKWTIANL